MKAGLLTPLYLSVSWVLTVSYQLFTDTAVRSVTGYMQAWWPAAATWLNAHVDTLIFIYAFTWIFVLSSVIPTVIMGKQRSILIQYIVVLTLSLVAFFMPDILQIFGGVDIQAIFNTAILLQNPVLAVLYLSMPYILMIGLDIHTRRSLRGKKQLEKVVEKISQAPAAE